eukprot:3957593-Prymnesium_polylepis.1
MQEPRAGLHVGGAQMAGVAVGSGGLGVGALRRLTPTNIKDTPQRSQAGANILNKTGGNSCENFPKKRKDFQRVSPPGRRCLE